MSKPLDLVGKRFGKLTVLERKPSDEKGQSMWLVRCDCGKEKIVRGHDLSQGKSTSCGCSRIKSCLFYKHGLSKDKLHGLWRNIKERCYNPNSKSYKYYGERGIKMCDEWENDFVSFYNWSHENGYKDGLQIDRIDVNGDYCPENCRWVSKIVQANNTRRNIYVTINGETKSMSDWCREIGINYQSVQTRRYKGWDTLLALTTPFDKSKSRIKKKKY